MIRYVRRHCRHLEKCGKIETNILATNSLKASDQNRQCEDSCRTVAFSIEANPDSLVIKNYAELTLGLIHEILGIRCSLISMFFRHAEARRNTGAADLFC